MCPPWISAGDGLLVVSVRRFVHQNQNLINHLDFLWIYSICPATRLYWKCIDTSGGNVDLLQKRSAYKSSKNHFDDPILNVPLKGEGNIQNYNWCVRISLECFCILNMPPCTQISWFSINQSLTFLEKNSQKSDRFPPLTQASFHMSVFFDRFVEFW